MLKEPFIGLTCGYHQTNRQVTYMEEIMMVYRKEFGIPGLMKYGMYLYSAASQALLTLM
jgi:hypothetical protein